IRTPKAEAAVVRWIALDENERLPSGVEAPQRLLHQRGADPAALVRRRNGQRRNLEDAAQPRLDVDVTDEDVADDDAVLLGDEREIRHKPVRSPYRLDQPRLDEAAERALVDV